MWIGSATTILTVITHAASAGLLPSKILSRLCVLTDFRKFLYAGLTNQRAR